MKLSYVTDSLGHLPFEDMLNFAAKLACQKSGGLRRGENSA